MLAASEGPIELEVQESAARRFPLEWIEGQPRRLRGLIPAIWALLVVMGLGAGLFLYGAWDEQRRAASGNGAPPHTVQVEGIIEDLGPSQDSFGTVTVVSVTGRPVTAQTSFSATSVFGSFGVLSIAHLKLGQEVRMVSERGRAKTIELVRQPPVRLLR